MSMTPERNFPTQMQENPQGAEVFEEEIIREEVKGLSVNGDALRNTLSVLTNAGLEALKGIFKRN